MRSNSLSSYFIFSAGANVTRKLSMAGYNFGLPFRNNNILIISNDFEIYPVCLTFILYWLKVVKTSCQLIILNRNRRSWRSFWRDVSPKINTLLSPLTLPVANLRIICRISSGNRYDRNCYFCSVIWRRPSRILPRSFFFMSNKTIIIASRIPPSDFVMV